MQPDLTPADAVVIEPDPRVEHNRFISDAWLAGHELAAEVHGDSAPNLFGGAAGERLMAELQALPVGTPAEAFHAAVTRHVGAKP